MLLNLTKNAAARHLRRAASASCCCRAAGLPGSLPWAFVARGGFPPCSVVRLEALFARAAHGACPVVGKLLERRSRLDAVFRVAQFRVVDVLADGADKLFHRQSLVKWFHKVKRAGRRFCSRLSAHFALFNLDRALGFRQKRGRCRKPLRNVPGGWPARSPHRARTEPVASTLGVGSVQASCGQASAWRTGGFARGKQFLKISNSAASPNYILYFCDSNK